MSTNLIHDGILFVTEYDPRLEDMLNGDETGMIFGVEPHRTLALTKNLGTKKVLQCLTVLL